MSPVSGKTDPTGAVYVLDRYIDGRLTIPVPYTNAERPDTDFFYKAGVYDNYPGLKTAYEARRAKEAKKRERVRVWARDALAAADAGNRPPATSRPALSEVLGLLYRAGPTGLTRPEISRRLDRDGGKISGVMTDLHDAGIIFPLEGVPAVIENQTCPKVLKRTAHDAHEWWSDRGNGERLVNCPGYGVPGASMAVDQPCHMVREAKPHDPHGWWANHGPDERLARCPGYDIRAASQPVSLPELQRAVEAWVNHNFPGTNRVADALGLAEETGELCRAILKQEQGIRGTYEEWQAEIAKEIGDVLIKLCSVATTCEIDLEFAVRDRWETIRLRDFRADPTGHGIPDVEGHS